MLIGVPKEIKNHEYRVGMTPSSVQELVTHGHEVVVETETGIGIGIQDEDYRAVGARIAKSAQQVFAEAEMIVKVKEPQPQECKMLREGQLLFAYLHLAPDPEQTRLLLESGCIAIAYETVTNARGGLPLLSPMSEVAGRMSVQAGAHCLEKAQGGSGVLLGGVPGVAPAKVVVLGGGVAGTNAARNCVVNMPGAVARTAAFALNNATLPYILALADKGYKEALLSEPHLLNGLNIYKGLVTYEAVARNLRYPYIPAVEALAV